MNAIAAAVADTWAWIQRDYASHPFRFCVEVTAWLIGLSCSLLMAITMPTPWLHISYPMWLCGCAMYGWAAWTRRSFGMLANYTALFTIDTIATIRLFTA